MRQQNFSTRRQPANTWSRNRNFVRHSSKTLGTFSSTVLVVVSVFIMGLIFISQSTQATSYDYELSRLDDEIAELQARKEDLNVEKARRTSIAASSDSEVAANMASAQVSGYAE